MSEKPNQIRQAYDKIAETYHTKTEENDNDGIDKNSINKFIDSLDEGARILDAGCGGDPIETPNATTIGIDISGGQLRHYTGPIQLTQGDMMSLPFLDNSFDAATAFYSLIHIPLDNHQTVIDELSRVVRPGGSILIVEGTTEWVGSNESWLDTGEAMYWEMAGKDATIEQLKQAGFITNSITPVRDTLGDADGEKLFFLAQKQ